MTILTKDALNVGTGMFPYVTLCTVVIVRAPGGRLITIWDSHMNNASVNNNGVALKAAGLKITKIFDLMLNKSSMVETFIVSTRRRYHRYWTKATASAALRLKPNTLASTFEAVET